MNLAKWCVKSLTDFPTGEAKMSGCGAAKAYACAFNNSSKIAFRVFSMRADEC
jgi:hypothetical protein